jgi:hypothetical protein
MKGLILRPLPIPRLWEVGIGETSLPQKIEG